MKNFILIILTAVTAFSCTKKNDLTPTRDISQYSLSIEYVNPLIYSSRDTFYVANLLWKGNAGKPGTAIINFNIFRNNIAIPVSLSAAWSDPETPSLSIYSNTKWVKGDSLANQTALITYK